MEDGEKPTKYFSNLDARNCINNIIKRVELEGGNNVYNKEEIMNQVKLFINSYMYIQI